MAVPSVSQDMRRGPVACLHASPGFGMGVCLITTYLMPIPMPLATLLVALVRLYDAATRCSFRYIERCREAGEQPKPKGDCSEVPSSMTAEQLRRFLARLRQRGILRRSPDCLERHRHGTLLAYATEQIVFVPPKTYCCGTQSSFSLLHLPPYASQHRCSPSPMLR